VRKPMTGVAPAGRRPWLPPVSARSAMTLLAGNFGDRGISAFDPAAGAFPGQLHDPAGHPVTITGRWAWPSATAAWAAGTTTLFFTAGPTTKPAPCPATSSPHSTDGAVDPWATPPAKTTRSCSPQLAQGEP
jgi:hypothetical protein